MNNAPTDLISPEKVVLDKWLNILSHPDFNTTVQEYLSKRIEEINSQVEVLNRDITQDNLLKASNELAKKAELKRLQAFLTRKHLEAIESNKK